jgi:hypothetical protein
MTIHQSKGLEFDAVFLPTLDQTISARPPLYVAMYGDRTKPPIGVTRYMNRGLQKFLSETWQIAFREFGNQQLAEALLRAAAAGEVCGLLLRHAAVNREVVVVREFLAGLDVALRVDVDAAFVKREAGDRRATPKSRYAGEARKATPQSEYSPC